MIYTISEVLDMSPSENFDITDQLYWMEEPRKVYCGPIKVERLARIGVLEDTKNSIKILIWGTLTETINESKTNKFSNVTCNFFNDLRIYTNSSTIADSTDDEVEVNWDINNFHQEICCPFVDAVKINSYLQCINIDCKWKVVPQGNETKVTCMNNSYKRKMVL